MVDRSIMCRNCKHAEQLPSLDFKCFKGFNIKLDPYNCKEYEYKPSKVNYKLLSIILIIVILIIIFFAHIVLNIK